MEVNEESEEEEEDEEEGEEGGDWDDDSQEEEEGGHNLSGGLSALICVLFCVLFSADSDLGSVYGERLDQGHLHPNLEVLRLTCPGRESNLNLHDGRRTL